MLTARGLPAGLALLDTNCWVIIYAGALVRRILTNDGMDSMNEWMCVLYTVFLNCS